MNDFIFFNSKKFIIMKKERTEFLDDVKKKKIKKFFFRMLIFFLIIIFISFLIIYYADLVLCLDDADKDTFINYAFYRDYNYNVVYKRLYEVIEDKELYEEIIKQIKDLKKEVHFFDPLNIMKILREHNIDISIKTIEEWVIQSREKI